VRTASCYLQEDLKLSVKVTLADVVKSVHRVITPALEEEFLRGEGACVLGDVLETMPLVYNAS